jgi:hypothetical protein
MGYLQYTADPAGALKARREAAGGELPKVPQQQPKRVLKPTLGMT